MAVQKTYTTDEDFERLIALPECALRFEFIDSTLPGFTLAVRAIFAE